MELKFPDTLCQPLLISGTDKVNSCKHPVNHSEPFFLLINSSYISTGEFIAHQMVITPLTIIVLYSKYKQMPLSAFISLLFNSLC